MIDASRVVLVGCGAAKLSRPAPARELYTSNLFRLGLRYAETIAAPERIFVLSAMHGVVDIDKVLAPYNRKLSDLGGKRDRENWGGRTIDVLVRRRSIPRRPERGDLIVLAGKDYVDAIALPARDVGFKLVDPLNGLTQGARLKWLSTALAAQTTA